MEVFMRLFHCVSEMERKKGGRERGCGDGGGEEGQLITERVLVHPMVNGVLRGMELFCVFLNIDISANDP